MTGEELPDVGRLAFGVDGRTVTSVLSGVV